MRPLIDLFRKLRLRLQGGQKGLVVHTCAQMKKPAEAGWVGEIRLRCRGGRR